MSIREGLFKIMPCPKVVCSMDSAYCPQCKWKYEKADMKRIWHWFCCLLDHDWLYNDEKIEVGTVRVCRRCNREEEVVFQRRVTRTSFKKRRLI